MKIKRLGDLFGLTSKSTEPSSGTEETASEVQEVQEVQEIQRVEAISIPGHLDEGELRPAEDEAFIQNAEEAEDFSMAVEPEIPSAIDGGMLSLTEMDNPPPATQDPVMEASSNSITYTAQQLEQGQQLLDGFLQRCEGAYGVIVSSIDGNPVVHQTNETLPVARLANMTSSLLALGETIARESLQKLCRFVILENQDGRVVCLRINRVLMLTCITGKQSNLGMVLNIGQKTSEGLSEVF